MIPPSTSHLQNSAAQGKSSPPNTAIRGAPLSLKPNQWVEAKVISAEEITSVARAKLVANLQKQLTNLGSTQGADIKAPLATQTQRGNLLQSIQLLRSPLLLLVKIQHQQLQQLIYTDKPLQSGQNIPVQLQADGRLTMPAAPTTEHSLKSALITQALRQALPLQQPQNTLFDQFKQVAAHPKSQQLLPNNILNSVNKVLQSTKTPEQLSNPQQLKNTLANSGPLLENKLAKQLSSTQSQTSLSNPSTATDLKVLLAHTLKLTSASLAAATPSQPTVGTTPSPLNANILSSSEIKLLLQQISNSAPTQPSSQGQLSNQQQQTQLTLLLHQQLLSSMARVQVKQLQSLPQQGEQGLQPQTLQLEIPIRWGDHTHNLEVKIEERPDEDGDNRSEQNKERQWQITLCFDLLEHGHFHARLDIHGQHIKAKLWADNPNTFSAAHAQLQALKGQLQEQGLVVDELNCQKGEPQQSSNRLSYQLVDIKT